MQFYNTHSIFMGLLTCKMKDLLCLVGLVAWLVCVVFWERKGLNLDFFSQGKGEEGNGRKLLYIWIDIILFVFFQFFAGQGNIVGLIFWREKNVMSSHQTLCSQKIFRFVWMKGCLDVTYFLKVFCVPDHYFAWRLWCGDDL